VRVAELCGALEPEMLASASGPGLAAKFQYAVSDEMSARQGSSLASADAQRDRVITF